MSRSFDLARVRRHCGSALLPSWLMFRQDTFRAFALAQQHQSRRFDWSKFFAVGARNTPPLSGMSAAAHWREADRDPGMRPSDLLVEAWQAYVSDPERVTARMTERADALSERWQISDNEVATLRDQRRHRLRITPMPKRLDLQGADFTDVSNLWVQLHVVGSLVADVAPAVRNRVAAEQMFEASDGRSRANAARLVATVADETEHVRSLQDGLERFNTIVALLDSQTRSQLTVDFE